MPMLVPASSLSATMLPRSSACSQCRSAVPVPSYQTIGVSAPGP